MNAPVFAVIDFETTGLSPFQNHRIVEAAVVLVDSQGKLLRSWDSVINPERNVDGTDIHGLTAGNLVGAPIFSDIAGDLVDLLRGKILVSHNFSFDSMFLSSELERTGNHVALDRNAGLCTMKLASRYLASSSRALSACCSSVGIDLHHAHSALADATAAAQLLSHYIQSSPGFVDEWEDVCDRSLAVEWPMLMARRAPVTRVAVKNLSKEHFLTRLVSRSPRSNLYPEANSYLDLLDNALVDKHLSEHEISELLKVASHLDLSKEEVESLHADYFSGLVSIAYEDGQLTEQEESELKKIAIALGMPEVRIEEVGSARNGAALIQKPRCGPTLVKGDSIVFTGGDGDRDALVYQAKALGLRVVGMVSGKTKYLVAADPDSLSGKSRKARELGIQIISYEMYNEMIKSIL